MDLKQYINTIENYPKEGIMFRDITSLLKNPEAFRYCIKQFVLRYKDLDLDAIIGIESRGFIFGAALAHELSLPFIPIRKKGKLPGKVYSQEYQLEYGSDCMEIHCDALKQKSKVVIIDDLLATGGTMLAASKLMNKFEVSILETAFIIDLPDLGGSKKLEQSGLKVFKMVDFEGE